MLQMGSYHTRMIDYYSLGCLLYEMLIGIPPFFSDDRHEMYSNIVNEELVFPKGLD